jgi:hypothetical protein
VSEQLSFIVTVYFMAMAGLCAIQNGSCAANSAPTDIQISSGVHLFSNPTVCLNHIPYAMHYILPCFDCPILCLLNNAFSNAKVNSVEWDSKMNMNVVYIRIWQEGVVTCWKEPSCHWPGETKIQRNWSVRLADRLIPQWLEPVISVYKSTAFLPKLQLDI